MELVAGATVSDEELKEYAINNIGEPGAKPKHLEILKELPKTAVGKVFKPDLRKMAITRIFDQTNTTCPTVGRLNFNSRDLEYMFSKGGTVVFQIT